MGLIANTVENVSSNMSLTDLQPKVGKLSVMNEPATLSDILPAKGLMNSFVVGGLAAS